MSGYISSADFRPGSGKWYTHGNPLTVDDADNNSLSDAITAMSETFDLYTSDHFSPEPGDGPPESTTTIDISGNGGPNLSVPKRIRSISDVSLRDRDGTLTSQDPAVYRVTQSLVGGERTEGDLDQIALIPGRYLTGTGFWDDWTYSGSWTDWPIGINTVQLTGTFSWSSTPELVKRAVALMVYQEIKPSTDPLQLSERWATPTASMIMAPKDPTGITKVDEIIKQFTRSRVPVL